MKKISVILFFLSMFSTCFTQESKQPELILQNLGNSKSRLFKFKNQIVVTNKICSDTRLKKDKYLLNNKLLLEDIIGEYNFDGIGKYEYGYCEFYGYSDGNKLELNSKTLVQDISSYKEFEEIELNESFRFINDNITKCNNKEIRFDNLIGVLYFKDIVITNELIESNNFISILNSECLLYERIKFSDQSLEYAILDDFFILKGKNEILAFLSNG